MALKKRKRVWEHSHYGRKRGEEAAELAAQLAPPEEVEGRAGAERRNNGGAIKVDTSSIKITQEFIEREKRERRIMGLEPVVVVILVVVLSFIAFIAWQISLMEPPE